MSCSKIFSGDLPELTYEVIKYFQNDFSTLHSCILVNRLWCRLAIPLLWENPFLFSFRTGNSNVIEIYLHNLNDDLKTELSEYRIINYSLPPNTLFNYSRFLKYLNIRKFVISFKKWFDASIRENTETNFSKLTDIVCIPLFKILIENEVNLHTLEIEISHINHYIYKFLELILQNTNFIHNISNLNLYIGSFYENKVIKNLILQIINLHQGLKKISLAHNNLPLYQSLLLSKSYNCSNTLNTIIFFSIDFESITNLDIFELFEQLNVLESVHMAYCFLSNRFFQQIISLTKPFKLKSLIKSFLRSGTDESFQSLLQKSGDYLENIEFGYNSNIFRQQILKYCKNIKFLKFNTYESLKITYELFNLIENNKYNLNYLLISDYCLSSEYSSFILQNLGQALPSKIEYLSLELIIKKNDFITFLENSQDIFINKLLIMQKGSDYILYYIKEYILKEKKVKYLAIKNGKNDEDELSDLKDEVKEFKLHNIRVQSYSNLSININNDFILNID